jgi:small conductance mechanosensitive channel
VSEQQITEYTELAIRWGTQLVTALAILVVGWVISRWFHRIVLRGIERRNLDQALGRFLAALARWAVFAATLIVALDQVGIPTTSLLAMFASAGLAIGLALQGSLANFASGVLLLVFRPFNLGDTVATGDNVGRVDDIGLFSTTLVTGDNRRVVVPNSSLTTNTIVNITAQGTRRLEVDVGVAYGSDPDQVVATLMAAVRACPALLTDPEPLVVMVGLGASSLDFRVFAWCNSDDYLLLGHQIRVGCYRALGQAGIEIPYPQLVIHRSAS